MHTVMSQEQIAANRRNARLSTGPKPAPARPAPPKTTRATAVRRIKISNRTHLQSHLQLRIDGLDVVPTPML